MEDRKNILTFEQQRELFLKWGKYLLYMQHGMLIMLVVNTLFSVEILNWFNRFLSIGIAFILNSLSAINLRYRKASIFAFITIILLFLSENIFILVMGAVCILVATYQEYMAHSEAMNNVDERLENCWQKLFRWWVWGGPIICVLGIPIIMVLALIFKDSSKVLAVLFTLVLNGFSFFIRVMYVKYLKQMLHVYEIGIQTNETIADIQDMSVINADDTIEIIENIENDDNENDVNDFIE